jgi:hypothetical protein
MKVKKLLRAKDDSNFNELRASLLKKTATLKSEDAELSYLYTKI